MRVILRFECEQIGVRKMLLRSNQVLKVGRTAWADFSIPHDPQLSPIHFSLRNDGRMCCVEDLSSSGTFVNDQRVNSATLCNGDRIRAGDSAFQVDIQDGPPATRSRALCNSPADRIILPPPSDRGAAEDVRVAEVSRMQYQVQACRSGLSLFCGSAEQVPPSAIARLLTEAQPLYLIVDFNKLHLPHPGQPTAADYVMDFLPEEARETSSPVILSPAHQVDLYEVLEAGWGKDAVIGVYSDAGEVEVISQLRSALGVYVRPSLLLPQLTRTPPAFAENVFSKIRATLVEGQSPEQWSVIAREEFDQTLEELGLERQAAES